MRYRAPVHPISRAAFAVAALLLVFCTTGAWAEAVPQSAPRPPPDLAVRLRGGVEMLSAEIGERNCYRPQGLEKAASWIEQEFVKAGYAVKRESVPTHPVHQCRTARTENLIAELTGSLAPEQIVIVGAHYDSKVATPGWHDHGPVLPDAPGTPGADDNASGVTAVLAIAEMLGAKPLERTVRFVAFVNEEPPFFRKMEYMGSGVHASGARKRNEQILGMLSLETLGLYSSQPHKKRRKLLGLASLAGLVEKPSYVAFLGAWGSCGLIKKAAEFYRRTAVIPVRTLCLPRIASFVAWSDDWAFWNEGYPAFSITDTAYLRHDHYHELSDTADRLDYEPFAAVVAAMEDVVRELAVYREKE